MSSEPSDRLTCYCWDLASGTERTLDLQYRVKNDIDSHEWLIKFNLIYEEVNKVLIWNVQSDAQYIIELQGPYKLQLEMVTRFHKDGDSVVGFLSYPCDEHCKHKDVKLYDDGHEDERVTHYFMTRHSIVNGCKISCHDVFYADISRADFQPSIRPRITDRNGQLLLDSHPFLKCNKRMLSMPSCAEAMRKVYWSRCYFDMITDDISITRRVIPIAWPDSDISQEDSKVRIYSWKNVSQFYNQQSSKHKIYKAMWAIRFDANGRVMDCHEKKGSGIHCEIRLFTLNDMFVIGKAERHLVISWFDKLAYSRARKWFDEFPCPEL